VEVFEKFTGCSFETSSKQSTMMKKDPGQIRPFSSTKTHQSHLGLDPQVVMR
jgi:hypothetical protein